eukprot:2118741-Heterocapsa_arctica.AAC.1
MEYERPGERTKENKTTVMYIVCYVAKRMRGSIIYGGTAEHSTSIQTLDISNFYKSDKQKQHQPECFWNTGVVTTDRTTLPESEHMETEDLCHECKGTAKTVFIHGSSYKLGN